MSDRENAEHYMGWEDKRKIERFFRFCWWSAYCNFPSLHALFESLYDFWRYENFNGNVYASNQYQISYNMYACVVWVCECVLLLFSCVYVAFPFIQWIPFVVGCFCWYCLLLLHAAAAAAAAWLLLYFHSIWKPVMLSCVMRANTYNTIRSYGMTSTLKNTIHPCISCHIVINGCRTNCLEKQKGSWIK